MACGRALPVRLIVEGPYACGRARTFRIVTKNQIRLGNVCGNSFFLQTTVSTRIANSAKKGNCDIAAKIVDNVNNVK